MLQVRASRKVNLRQLHELLEKHCAYEPEVVVTDDTLSQTRSQIPEERIEVRNIRAINDDADIALCRLAVIACACVADTTFDLAFSQPDLLGPYTHQEVVRDAITLPRYLWYDHDFDSQTILQSSVAGTFEGSVDRKLRLVWNPAVAKPEVRISQLHVAWGDRQQGLEHSGPREAFVILPDYVPGHYRQNLEPIIPDGLDVLNAKLGYMLSVLRPIV